MFDDWAAEDRFSYDPDSVGASEPSGFESFGDPEAAYDPESWSKQETGFTCAVVSQRMILQQFGIEVSEAELVYEATSGGFLTDGGTSPEDMGRLLEMHGVPVHHSHGVQTLIDDLAHGRKAIVAVDSGELWGEDSPLEDAMNPYGADHAVVVTGLDLSDPDNPKVVINDPGHPDGAGRAYPFAEFLNAWSDSNELYVATDEAPPELAAEPVIGNSFDAETGMYMDGDYWAQFKQQFVGNLTDNLGTVAERWMEEGDAVESVAAAVLKSTTETIHDLNEVERNSLLRSL